MQRTIRGSLLGVVTGALLLATAACSGAGEPGDDSPGEPVALVQLAPATRTAIAPTLTLYGEVARSGEGQAVLAAPVEGVVESIAKPAGSAVRAGALVARLRPSPATMAQVSDASAQAAAAKQALARAERLRKGGLASDADVETARAASVAASALAASLAKREAGLAMRAPYAGFVDTVGASPGDLVQPGAVVATVSRGGGAVARFGIDPEMAQRVTPGMAIEIRQPGGGAPIETRIASVSPVADPQTRLATVLVRLSSRLKLAVGNSLTGKIATAPAGEAVSVPYAALLNDGGQPYVYVVAKGVAHRHDVVLGPTDGQRAAILKGVAAGEQVVTVGGTALEDGMKVRTR